METRMNKGLATGKFAHLPEDMIQPAEWALHKSCWLAWPSHGELWEENLEPTQKEFVGLCTAIADPVGDTFKGERLNILIPFPEALETAKKALKGLPVTFHQIPFGDIWVRDTAPVFMKRAKDNSLVALQFEFNGWGGKYELPHDGKVSEKVAQASGVSTFRMPFILEGGSIEVDGEGTCLTTRQCLLNPNRNPGMTEQQVEDAVKLAYGVKKIIWLKDGLLNDHTDGHIDTIARFAAPGVVLCMKATGADDPNREVMDEMARDLEAAVDAQGRKLKVIRVPSPGRILDEEGEVMPASYMNFYISNTSVIVPIYGSKYDAEAVEMIARHFPGRKTVGLPAKSILSGGGAFHCITQQEPLEA
jgi:agmatine deiminase